MEDLPENIMFDILSRLSVKTIIYCKCTCKNWRNLVIDSYFVKLHLSRSHEGLLIDQYTFSDVKASTRQGNLMWVEIDHHRLFHDPHIIVDLNDANLFHDMPTNCKGAYDLVGSVNGLTCLWAFGLDNTYIFNPITKEYTILPKQHFFASISEVIYGFGVSLFGEHKVVRIFQSKTLPNPNGIEVYTLGTDQRRSLGQVPYNLSGYEEHGLFFNNHVHWIIADKLHSFDLENETFQLFPSPLDEVEIYCGRQCLGVLKDFLSLFYYSYYQDLGYTIWMMREHGNHKSWQKELVIEENITRQEPQIWRPLSLSDGLNGSTILVVHVSDKDMGKLVAYCLKTNTVQDTITSYHCITATTYRPSFLKLPTTSNMTS